MSAEPPSPAASSPKPPSTPTRPKTAGESRAPPFFKNKPLLQEPSKRDSGLASSVSTMGHDSLLEGDSSSTPNKPAKSAVPFIVVDGDSPTSSPGRTVDSRPRTAPSRDSSRAASLTASHKTPASAVSLEDFRRISTSIPSGAFDDPFASHLSFTKRGSVLLDGKRATNGVARTPGKAQLSAADALSAAPSNGLSLADRRLSQRVRLMYERGDENAIIERIPEDPEEQDSAASLKSAGLPRDASVTSFEPELYNGVKAEPWEAAGGIEDWRDVQSGDVDRYGFFKPRELAKRTSSNLSGQTAEQQGTSDDASRRPAKGNANAKNSRRLSLLSTHPKSRHSSRPPSRAPSKAESTAPSFTSVRSGRSTFGKSSGINKGRSWADEAPDMLTDTAALPGSSTEKPVDPAKAAVERRREAKWEEMSRSHSAAATKRGKSGQALGGGTDFEFDVTDKKLIERTWKGIPDRWRASAWRSFLLSSARRNATPDRPFIPDEELTRRFHAHQARDCGDDMQIDMDVPRTISGHLMFRARYRGGQRLLFRVLRALALEYSGTGYVQGMAPLVATLLCYYDEERAFAVACRLWELRGLAELFRPGFAGLVGALGVFETHWLARLPARAPLDALGIPPMSYGTKWYLTLFCYSLPFPAQLRVWDVFILLGGGEGGVDGAGARRADTVPAFLNHVRATSLAESNETGTAAAQQQNQQDETPPSPAAQHGFDALHAVAAALMDGLAGALLGADFDDAMRLITAGVPVGREDVLMRVAKREWRERRRSAV